jgi:phosphoribosylglycinamide formyltransferase 1
MQRIAIFASGKGSNADALCHYFANHPEIRIAMILSDRKLAGVFDVAPKYGVSALYLSPVLLKKPKEIVEILKENGITFIVLAGYLKLVAPEIINAYHNRIINIHPALLPKFGGKGMFGMNVHNAVVKQQEEETGITIHYVNEHYDRGDIILQKKIKVEKEDSPQRIAEKINILEKEWLSKVVEQLLSTPH